MRQNRTYLMRRAAQEHAAAAHAKGKAREAHEQLAALYDEQVRGGEPAQRCEAAAAG